MLVDATNSNSHASIQRQENSERAEALLNMVNEYRMYAQRFETLPTWDILEWLAKLDREITERYNEALFDGERDRLKNEYFYLTGRRPFGGWSNEELQKRIEEFKEWGAISEETLESKKARWKKAMNKGGK